jgi:hypothetical protein
MTPKQEERIRIKITRIRKELAADKKRWCGFYDDSRGLRYLPPEQFIKLKDYKVGLRYLRWFDRTFSDDSGYPLFLFEWTLILFKTGSLKEAEKKAFETFAASNYIFDKFLEKDLLRNEKIEKTEWETAWMAENFKYSSSDPEYTNFVLWLESLQTGKKFYDFASELIAIDKRLESVPAGKTRTELVNRRYKMIEEL